MNDELTRRTMQLDESNAFLEAVLSANGTGVAVVDAEQHVQLWTPVAEDLWGLRADEAVGRHLMSLDIGLPVDALRAPLRRCLAGEAEAQTLEVAATNRRGKTITCGVRCLGLNVGGPAVTGAIILMEALAAS